MMPLSANDETRSAWNANAQIWDEKMGNDGSPHPFRFRGVDSTARYRRFRWPVCG
jgi:hypothetical protein